MPAARKTPKGLKPRITQPRKIQFTESDIKEQNMSMATAQGCGMPVLLLLAGLFALIPIIGWLISIALLFLAFGSGANTLLLASGLTSTGSPKNYWLKGECPYCTHPVEVVRKEGGELNATFHRCTTCKERVLIKEDVFSTIPKVYSEIEDA